jgi:tetrahydromethanopterin S-methyltransferase subunit G
VPVTEEYAHVEDPLVIFTGPSPRGWHRLQMAAECLQKYAWSYENGPRKDISKKPPLAIGSLLHLALAQFYARMKQEQEGKNPNEYMDPAEAVRLVARVQDTEKHVKNVLATFRAYEQRYWQDINTRRIVAVETLYDGTVGPFRLTGRLDLMYEDLGGRLWAEDHKTSGRLTKKHKEYFAVSGQMLGYEHIVRQQNPALAGFKVNLIQHTGHDATNDPKFERVTLPARPALSAQFVERAIDIERSIERTKAEGRAVDEWPKAMSELVCYHRYGACDYIDQCRFGPQAKKAGAWEFDMDDWG